MKSIKRQVEGEFQDEVCREQDVTVGAQTIETDAEIVAEGMNDGEDSIGDTEVWRRFEWRPLSNSWKSEGNNDGRKNRQ